MFVPVVSNDNQPLMPTSPSRARKLVKCGEAVPFFRIGIFCIKLKTESESKLQSTTLAIDPGSKREGYSIKSASHTYINIQSNAIDGVKEKLEERRCMRRGRRFRKTPCRKPRWANRGSSLRPNRVPPSTKSRWDLKISISQKLSSIYPIKFAISGIMVEDIKAMTKKGAKKWNKSFSPLECGKKYFYNELRKLGYNLVVGSGYGTYLERKILNLYKTKDKLSDDWHAHCVDSWVMANKCVGGHSEPDNTDTIFIRPISFGKNGAGKRHLHESKYRKGSIIRNGRIRDGGTRSLSFTKGSIVRYCGVKKANIKNNGFYLVGGNDGTKLSLHSIKSYERLNRTIDPNCCRFVSYNRFAIS